MDEDDVILEFEKYLQRRFPGRRTPVDESTGQELRPVP
jgi:hypothetical protein